MGLPYQLGVCITVTIIIIIIVIIISETFVCSMSAPLVTIDLLLDELQLLMLFVGTQM
jgi:hypothetical protein